MFRKIVNVVAIVFFVAIWLILIYFKSNYEHSTFQILKNDKTEKFKIAQSSPIFYDSTTNQIYGFCKEIEKNSIDCFFIISLFDHKIDFFDLPANYQNVLGYSKNNKEIVWMSHNDSLSSLLEIQRAKSNISVYYDSILLDINLVIGFGFKNNKPEIALRNPIKNNVIIYTFYDTIFDVRIVRFPIFYQSFSIPNIGYVDKNNWQFLCKALYNEQQYYWRRYDTTQNMNIIRFQENISLPFFYDLLPYPYHTPISSYHYLFFQYLPASHLMFRSDTFLYVPHSTPSQNIIDINTKAIWSILDDTVSVNFIRYDLLLNELSLRKSYEGDKVYYYSKDDKNFDNNLFFVPINNNFSGYINLNNDSIFLLTEDFHYLYINADGISYISYNLINHIVLTINEKLPQKYKILDGYIPNIKAMGIYTMLIGPFVLWIIVWIIVWLINLFSKEKNNYKYYTYHRRTKKKHTITYYTFIGSIIYIIAVFILFQNFLQVFNIL
ncbi:MAG: hypothetical protein PHT45_03170 [Bacteroidales bacterium]|nr:hypothetical protein [Bacteroidales bacterium]